MHLVQFPKQGVLLVGVFQGRYMQMLQSLLLVGVEVILHQDVCLHFHLLVGSSHFEMQDFMHVFFNQGTRQESSGLIYQ